MILKLTAFLSDLHTVATGLLPEVNAMYIKGQFMFATKNITTTNNTVVSDFFSKIELLPLMKSKLEITFYAFVLHNVELVSHIINCGS